MNKSVCELLDEKGIPYEIVEHGEVFTITDTEALNLTGEICKNLFVRDAKGKRHFLVVTTHDQSINLGSLGEKLNAGKLSFASPQRLEKYLGVTGGAVSPFGLLRDTEQAVTVVLDGALKGNPRLGFHPNRNTATVFLSWDEMIRFIESQGNDWRTLTL